MDPPARHCAVCGVQCVLACGACQKVFYCGGEHQTAHWALHRLGCVGTSRRPATAPTPNASATTGSNADVSRRMGDSHPRSILDGDGQGSDHSPVAMGATLSPPPTAHIRGTAVAGGASAASDSHDDDASDGDSSDGDGVHATRPSILAATSLLQQRDDHRQQCVAYLRLGDLRHAFNSVQCSFKATYRWHGRDCLDLMPDYLLMVTVSAATGFHDEGRRTLRYV